MKTLQTHTIIIEKLDFPIQYDGGSIENYRVRGTTEGGAYSWTGRGFETRNEALSFAEAVYTGIRLANAPGTIDDRTLNENHQ